MYMPIGVMLRVTVLTDEKEPRIIERQITGAELAVGKGIEGWLVENARETAAEAVGFCWGENDAPETPEEAQGA